MNVKTLHQQTQDAYAWTDKLLSSIAYDKWEHTPAVVESNIAWQCGHLLVSFYYHSIMSINGHQMDILKSMPMQLYGQLFTSAAPAHAVGKTNPEKLHHDFRIMQNTSLNFVAALQDEDLEKELAATEYPHPVAKTRYEALDWNIKHSMWHCGQLGLLKRIIEQQRFEFGLKRD